MASRLGLERLSTDVPWLWPLGLTCTSKDVSLLWSPPAPASALTLKGRDVSRGGGAFLRGLGLKDNRGEAEEERVDAMAVLDL